MSKGGRLEAFVRGVYVALVSGGGGLDVFVRGGDVDLEVAGVRQGKVDLNVVGGFAEPAVSSGLRRTLRIEGDGAIQGALTIVLAT